MRLAVNATGAFRLPSFTELYYDSPASVGNPALEPEKAWTGEVHLAFPWKGGAWQVGAFRRWARDLVDWVRSDTGVFVAQNYARAETTGAHLDVTWDQSCWRTSVAYLKSDIAVDPSRSAYALTHPRWEASLAGALRFARGVLTPMLSYRKPQGRGGFVLTDLAGRWPLEGPLSLEISLFNLTNRRYQEVPGVEQPGRWWTLELLFRP
ncbi:MAG: TonB-dependent receptor [Thermoanaerobaculaceae bacterium]